jgi:hypothetical protein
MTKAERPAAHIRHHGVMIDASFRKDGTVEYYVVQGGAGRYYGLHIAKEIAEAVARRKAI